MRIGFFTDRYFPLVDGVAVSVETFRIELEKLGHKVYVFCPAGVKKNPNEPDNIVRFRSYPSIWYEDHRDTMPWTPRNVNKIKSYKLDVAHIHTPAQIGLLGTRIALIENLPLIATHHTDVEKYAQVYRGILAGMLAGSLIGPIVVNRHRMIKETLPVFKPEKTFRKWNSKVVRRILATYYNNNDLVIAPSKKMYSQLIEYGVKTPITILPTGTQTNPGSSSLYNPRSLFKIADDQKLLLFVGRIGREKNIDLAIKAMSYITKDYSNTKLLIVGDGLYLNKIKDLVKKLKLNNQVFFTGLLSREDTLACYGYSDIFLFPSVTDTQGLVLNEAALAALPIVYCDDQISEVTINKKTGLLSKDDARDFSEKILYLINNSNYAIQLGKNGQKLAKKFSAEKQAKKIEKIYQKLIDEYNKL